MVEISGLQIDLTAVLVATVASAIIGFVWYAMLFAKPWTKEMGYDPKMRPDGKTMAKGMALMVVGNFLFAWVLAFYFAGWQYIPSTPELGTLAFALNSALSVWYHLVATGVVALIIAYGS